MIACFPVMIISVQISYSISENFVLAKFRCVYDVTKMHINFQQKKVTCKQLSELNENTSRIQIIITFFTKHVK